LSITTVVEVLADDVAEALPAGALALDPFCRLGQGLGTKRQAVRTTVDHPGDDAGLLEHLQMPRDGRLRHAEVPARLTDGGGAAAEALHDLTASRVRESGERIVSHSANIIWSADRTTKER
jgi:hypothetical protein